MALGSVEVAASLLSGCGTAHESDADRTSAAVSPKPAASPAETVQGRWWTWAASEGESTNPVTDTTGEFCDRNQPEDVWFFGGTVRRTCTVPAGRPVVFPLVNQQAGSKTVCEEFMATAEGRATLDGEPVTSERIEDDVTVTGAAGDPLTGEEGTFTSCSCGLWVRLHPLPPGRHTLTIRGSSGDFRTGVDYTLIVETGQQA